MSLTHPCQHGIGQSQDALPVNPWKEEALRWHDRSYINDDGPIWAFWDGDMVDAQFTFPVALGILNRHSLASWLVATGSKYRGGIKREMKREKKACSYNPESKKAVYNDLKQNASICKPNVV